MHDPAAVADRKKRAEAYQQQDPEKVKAARRKASESLRSRWGMQLHRRYGFKNGKRCQHALGHRAPTSASVFFHIHRGCSANVMIHHRTWKREMSWHKKPRKKKRTASRVWRRRPLTEEERLVRPGNFRHRARMHACMVLSQVQTSYCQAAYMQLRRGYGRWATSPQWSPQHRLQIEKFRISGSVFPRPDGTIEATFQSLLLWRCRSERRGRGYASPSHRSSSGRTQSTASGRCSLFEPRAAGVAAAAGRGRGSLAARK